MKKRVSTMLLVAFLAVLLTSVYGGQAEAVWSTDNSGLFRPFVTYQVNPDAEAVAVGDVNNDGLNDVVLTTTFNVDYPENDYHLFVFLQNENGELDSPITYPTTGSYTKRPESIDIGDVNNDGKNDVVIGNSELNIEVFIQNTSGGLEPGVAYLTNNSLSIKIGDLNNDGRMDVAGLGWGNDSVDVFLQNESGALGAPINYIVSHGGYDEIEVEDVNNDTYTDIIVMSGQGFDDNIGILLQQPGGNFAPAVYYDLGGDQLTSGVAAGDINNDGLKDLIVTYGGNKPNSFLGVFSQNSDNTLDPAISYPAYDCPESVALGDFNLDGKDDVVVLHGGWYEAGIYLQGDDGLSTDEELYSIPYATHYNPQGLDVGDINADGTDDIVIADYNNGLVILYGAPPGSGTPDTTLPKIIATSAITGVNNVITITFSEPVQATEYFSGTTLKTGTTVVDYTYTLNGSTLTLTPTGNLAYSTLYTLQIPYNGITDLAGNKLDMNILFSFTTQAAPRSGGGGSSNTPTSAPTTPGVSLSPSITTTTEQKDGQSVTTVTVNESTALETVNQSPTGSTIVFPVNETSNVVSARIPPGLLVALLKKSSVMEIQTPTGAYLLPAGEINMAKLAKELGVNNADVSINIVISQAKPQQVAAITKFTQQHNLTQLVTPVEFQVEGLAGDKKVEVNNFSSYVSRTIKLSQAVNPATTVGVVANPDGTLSPVPTQFIVVDGKTEAVLKRKTNSTYSVVANKKTFADVKGHWAKEDIDTLASKLIIQGNDKSMFVPENKVSRAEVAALIIRALGLVPQPAQSAFRDIKSSDWYIGYVGSAVEAGIINGYDDGSFKPNAYATREEVIAMLIRALKVAGVETKIAETEVNSYLVPFTDNIKTSTWAKSALAVAAKNEIIKGNVSRVLAPTDNTTRAELAVMLKRMLSKANFI